MLPAREGQRNHLEIPDPFVFLNKTCPQKNLFISLTFSDLSAQTCKSLIRDYLGEEKHSLGTVLTMLCCLRGEHWERLVKATVLGPRFSKRLRPNHSTIKILFYPQCQSNIKQTAQQPLILTNSPCSHNPVCSNRALKRHSYLPETFINPTRYFLLFYSS